MDPAGSPIPASRQYKTVCDFATLAYPSRSSRLLRQLHCPVRPEFEISDAVSSLGPPVLTGRQSRDFPDFNGVAVALPQDLVLTH